MNSPLSSYDTTWRKIAPGKYALDLECGCRLLVRPRRPSGTQWFLAPAGCEEGYGEDCRSIGPAKAKALEFHRGKCPRNHAPPESPVCQQQQGAAP